MAINTRDVDWSTPPVLLQAVDALGRCTTDLAAVAEGDLLLTMTDGTTRVVPFNRALLGVPTRVTV